MASYPDWIAHTARDGVSMVAAAEGKGITSTCSRSSGRRTERDILACRGDQGRRRRARRSLFPQTSSLASLFQNNTAPMPPPWIPPPCPYCHKYRINPPLTFNYIMPPLVTSAPGELRRLHRLRAHEWQRTPSGKGKGRLLMVWDAETPVQRAWTDKQTVWAIS